MSATAAYLLNQVGSFVVIEHFLTVGQEIVGEESGEQLGALRSNTQKPLRLKRPMASKIVLLLGQILRG